MGHVDRVPGPLRTDRSRGSAWRIAALPRLAKIRHTGKTPHNVRAVSAYASQLRANQRAFLGYYHWQVFYGDTLLPEGYPARPATPAPG